MTRGQILLFTLILGLLVATEAFTIDSSLPAMPAIAAGLGTDNAAVQLSLSAFMLGMALGQLFHGPMSDRFGRKPVMIGAVTVFTAAMGACLFVTDIESFTALRLVQGFASASGHILSRAVVRDRFDREDAARLLSYIMVILAIAPIVAPVMGAYLTEWFGWRAIFVFLTAYGLLVLMLNGVFLRESLATPDKTALRPSRMIGNYLQIGKSRMFWGYLICAASSFAGLFAFIAGSPFSLITFMGVSTEAFGYWFAFVMVGHMFALFAGAKYVGRIGIERMLGIGVYLAALSGIAMGILAWAGVATIAAIVVPAFFFMTAFALIVPQAVAGALSPFHQIVGSASSMLGFLQLAAGAGAGAAVGYFNDGTQRPMTTAIFIAGLVGLVGFALLVPKTKPVLASSVPKTSRLW